MKQLVQLLSLLVIRLRTGMNAMISIEEIFGEPYADVNSCYEDRRGLLTAKHTGKPEIGFSVTIKTRWIVDDRCFGQLVIPDVTGPQIAMEDHWLRSGFKIVQ